MYDILRYPSHLASDLRPEFRSKGVFPVWSSSQRLASTGGFPVVLFPKDTLLGPLRIQSVGAVGCSFLVLFREEHCIDGATGVPGGVLPGCSGLGAPHFPVGRRLVDALTGADSID